MNWRQDAACRGQDPELFFLGRTGPAWMQLKEAKKICGTCSVREACLRWALETGVDHGIWGGASEQERLSLKRRAARNRSRTRTN